VDRVTARQRIAVMVEEILARWRIRDCGKNTH
jgi:hypothetical protein